MTAMIQAFDRVAGSYDEWYYTPKGKQVFQVERDAIDKFLPEKGIGIEIGAGTGIFAEAITREDRTVICLDVSKGMLRQAKKRGLLAIMGDAIRLPLRAESLDFAYLVTIIEFLDTPVEVLNEIKYPMRREGDLIAVTINRESKWGSYYQKLKRENAPLMSYARFYTPDEVREMFVKAGWRLKAFSGTLTMGPDAQQPGDKYVKVKSNPGVLVVHARAF